MNRTFWLLFLIASPLVEGRRGGSTSIRGGSSARTSVSSSSNRARPAPYQPQTSYSNVRPNAVSSSNYNQRPTNFNSGYNSGYNGGYNQGYNHGYNNGYNSGYRQPQVVYTNSRNNGYSRGGSSFATGLLGGATGAIGGLLAFEAGKAIIRSATTPIHYNNRNYYWDNNYQPQSNEIQCSVPLSTLQAEAASLASTTTTDPLTTTTYSSVTNPSAQIIGGINNIQYQDGTRPKTVTWSCVRGFETCCGMDCCRVA